MGIRSQVILLKEATIHFHCLFDESRFSNICTIMELKELNRLCKHMKIFVLNSVKHKFFSARIVNLIILYLNDKFQTFALLRRSPLLLKKLVSYTNQSTDLQCKSFDWFLCNTSFYWKVFPSKLEFFFLNYRDC